MPSKSENFLMEKMRKIIHADGHIRFYKLIDKAGLSITGYNKIKSYFEAKYEDELMYDKENKEWISFASPVVEDAKVD